MELFKVISLTLPIVISGVFLIFAIKKNFLQILNIPLDHNLMINKTRLFGNNKTYRGLAIFVALSIMVSYLLRFFYQGGYRDFIHPVFNASPLLIGLMYSLSYTLGELINSAVKRQMGIAPGKIAGSSFARLQKFIDLSDGIIVVAAMLAIFNQVSAYQAIAAAVVGIGIHFGTDKLMQSLRLK